MAKGRDLYTVLAGESSLHLYCSSWSITSPKLIQLTYFGLSDTNSNYIASLSPLLIPHHYSQYYYRLSNRKLSTPHTRKRHSCAPKYHRTSPSNAALRDSRTPPSRLSHIAIPLSSLHALPQPFYPTMAISNGNERARAAADFPVIKSVEALQGEKMIYLREVAKVRFSLRPSFYPSAC